MSCIWKSRRLLLADGCVLCRLWCLTTGPRDFLLLSVRSAFAGLRTGSVDGRSASAKGFTAGLVLSTSLGLWLFTRILIPDVILTGAIALALWGFVRALDEGEAHPHVWSAVFAGAIGTGLLLKGLIAAVFPVGAAVIYLLITGAWREPHTWQRIRPFTGTAIALLIAAPWHVLATLRNPPYIDLTPRSEPGHVSRLFLVLLPQ